MAWWSTTKEAVVHVRKSIAAAWASFGTASGALDKNAAAVAREYHRSMYLWACVNKIVTTSAVPPLYIKTEKDRSLTAYEQKISDLLANPNPQWTRTDLVEYVALSLALTMRAFILKIKGVGDVPLELWPLDPTKVTVEYVPNTTTIKQFVYQPGTNKVVYPVEPDGTSDIIFLQRQGLDGLSPAKSPAEVAVPAAEVFNRILQKAADIAGNASNVTGVLSSNTDLDQEEVLKVKEKLDEFKTGGRHSGDTLVVANAEWKFARMSEEPASVMSVEIKDSLARDVCAIMGVPSQLMSIPGSQTYANYETAMTALITETVIPMYLGPLVIELTRALLRGRNSSRDGARGDSSVAFDIDAWPAMAKARLALAETAAKADMLTIDEQRELLGYPALENEDDGNIVPKVEKLRLERLKIEMAAGEPAGVNEAQT